MPVIPTYTAQLSSSTPQAPLAAPDTAVAGALSQVGNTVVQIGNALQQIQDDKDVVLNQLDYNKGMAEIEEKYKFDTGWSDIRQRRADDVKALNKRLLGGANERVRRRLEGDYMLAAQADAIRFNGEALKREGGEAENKIEKDIHLLQNPIVQARTPEEVERATSAFDPIRQTLSRFKGPLEAEKYVQKKVYDANYHRFIRKAGEEAAANRPLTTDEMEQYLTPDDQLRVQKHYKSLKKTNKQKVEARFQSRLNDAVKKYMSTNDSSDLADLRAEAEAAGNEQLVSLVDTKTKAYSALNSIQLQVQVESPNASPEELMEIALKHPSLTITPDTKNAAEVQNVRDEATRYFTKLIAARDADPAGYALAAMPKVEGESMYENFQRRIATEREQANNKNLAGTLLSKKEVGMYEEELDLVIQTNDVNRTKEFMKKIDQAQSLAPRMLSEMKASPLMQSALIHYRQGNYGRMQKLIGLSQYKTPSQADSSYVEADFADDVRDSNVMTLLRDQAKMSPLQGSPELMESVQKSMHIMYALGYTENEVDDMFDAFGATSTANVKAFVGTGVDSDDFQDGAQQLARKFPWKEYIPENHENALAVENDFRINAILVNADETDDRLMEGERGYYWVKPANGQYILHQKSGRPALVTQDEVISQTLLPR